MIGRANFGWVGGSLGLAMLVLGAVVECVRLGRESPLLARASTWLFALGAVFAVLAVGSGWLLAAHEQMRSDQQTTLEWHRWLGVATTVVSGLAWVTSAQASKGGWAAARRLIAILSGVLAIGTGYFGGELVWGRDWFKPSESTPTNETFSP